MRFIKLTLRLKKVLTQNLKNFYRAVFGIMNIREKREERERESKILRGKNLFICHETITFF